MSNLPPPSTPPGSPPWWDVPPSPQPLSPNPSSPRSAPTPSAAPTRTPANRSPHRPRPLVSALLTCLTATIAGAAGGFLSASAVSERPTPPATTPTAPPGQVFPGQSQIARAADRIAPSVVAISTTNPAGGSVGTGVVVSEDGEVLTNQHVVEGATELRVRLPGETRTRTAQVLAADAANDLALLKLSDVSGLTAAVFADPAAVSVGDPVVAMGYALGLDGGPSVTSGIVSALNRTLAVPDGVLDGLTQTDTPISSGNSGGPLVNLRGEVVGINTAVLRDTYDTAANNVGFAIGVAETLRVLELLRSSIDGTARAEGWLGVTVAPRTDGGQGAVVQDVLESSPASAAGLRAGDVVLAIAGRPVTGQAALVAAVRDYRPGDVVDLLVERDGTTLTLTATLAARQ